jgi:hypothetical protein
MFLDALVTARGDFEAELARHERALTGCVEEVRRDEHAARRDVALAVSAAVGGFASAAPSPPSPRPLPRDDDAPVTLPDAKPAVVLARAALQLVEARLDQPRTGVIRAGYLRRVARRKKPPYRFHRVEVRRTRGPAVLASAPAGDQSQTAKERTTQLVRGRCIVAVAQFGKGKQDAFSVSLDGERTVWLCASSQERDDWLRCLQGSLDDDHSTISPNDEASAMFDAAAARVARATDRETYVDALRSVASLGPSVSLRARDAFPAACASFVADVRRVRADDAAVEEPCGAFEQMRKDMRRDRVAVDGEVCRASHADAPETIAAALAARVLEESRRLSKGSLAELTEAGALTHAAQVLVECTRTVSGGDAYACVRRLCAPPGVDHVVVCPLNARASPLDVRVRLSKKRSTASPEPLPPPPPPTRSPPALLFAHKLFSSLKAPSDAPKASYGERLSSPSSSPPSGRASTTGVGRDESSSEEEVDLVASKPRRRAFRARVEIDVRATTLYRVCTADPRDTRDDTWALVRAVWDRTFSVLGEPVGGANFRAGDAVVHIGVSDFLYWEPSEEP